jgi:hypothetical protein
MEIKEDKLERFILDNQDQFNKMEPPPFVWKSIEEKLEQKKSLKPAVKSYLWKAAAAILIFASSWYLHDYFDARPFKKNVPEASAKVSENPVLGELSDAEAFYTTQINCRQAELMQYAKDHPDIIADLKKEFRDMDLKNNQLKRDLAESNADEKVIEAIILSYRMKLEILEEMLSEFRKNSSRQPERTVKL